MARLIDADKRIEEIKKIYCDGCDNYGGVKCRACWVDDAMCLIDDATTVDAVEVVRCRDCKRCFKHTTKRNRQKMWICMRNEVDVCVRPDDFCSYGERKEGADNG